jgi:hypothetical protein
VLWVTPVERQTAEVPAPVQGWEPAEIVDGVQEHERVVVDGTQHVRDGSTVEEANGGAS